METLKPSDLNFDDETITVYVCAIYRPGKSRCDLRAFPDRATVSSYIEDRFGNGVADDCEKCLEEVEEFAHLSNNGYYAFVRLVPIETEEDFR